MRWGTGVPIAIALVVTAGVLLARGWPEGGRGRAQAATPTEASVAATVRATPLATWTATPTATSTASPEEEVGAAYLAYWEAYARGARALEAGGFEEVMTGWMLERRRAEIADLRAQGQAVEIRVEHNFVVVEVDVEAATATVFDEYVNRSFLIDAQSGEAAGAEPAPTTLSDTYYLVQEDGRWKVHDATRMVFE